MSMRVVKPTKKPLEETKALRSQYKARRLLLEKAAGAVLGKDIPLSKDIIIFRLREDNHGIIQISEYCSGD